jgi:hypothetical protein
VDDEEQSERPSHGTWRESLRNPSLGRPNNKDSRKDEKRKKDENEDR